MMPCGEVILRDQGVADGGESRREEKEARR
jgi:hypothetical protein